MGLFGPRQVVDPEARRGLEEMRTRFELLESVLRQAQNEQVTMHDQVRKWMRRAVAAERAAERNQATDEAGHPAVVTPVPSAALADDGPSASAVPASRGSLRKRNLWGARGRIALRSEHRNGVAATTLPEPDAEAPELTPTDQVEE